MRIGKTTREKEGKGGAEEGEGGRGEEREENDRPGRRGTRQEHGILLIWKNAKAGTVTR